MVDPKKDDKKNASTRSVKKKKSNDGGKAKAKKADGGEKSAKSMKSTKNKKKSKEAKGKKSEKPKNQSVLQAPSEEPKEKEMEKSTRGKRLPELTPEGQKAAQAFLAHFLSLTPDQCSTEFNQVNSAPQGASVSEDLLKTATDPSIPCIEATAVKSDGSFYHCNRITLDTDDRQWIIAQPPKEDPEPFWRMIFEQQAPMVLVLGPAFDQGKKQYGEFFPEKKADYKYYGKMYVNNKKVDVDGGLTVLTFEVLPEGSSNSVTTKIVFSVGWGKGDMSQGNTCAKILQQMHKLEPGPIVSVSVSGTGRSCLISAVSLLSRRITSGNYSNVVDLVVSMRKQRAMAIPDKAHYGHIYAMLAYFLMTRSKDKTQWEQAIQRFKLAVAPGIAA